MLRNDRASRRWFVVAGAISTALLAAFASFAGTRNTRTPESDESSQLRILTTSAFRPATDERVKTLDDLGVSRWHQHGVRGKGVKVAVLDSGFRGYRSAMGKHLPSKIQARSFRFDGDLEARDSHHGILCAEVIHAIAPEAELLFANWEPDSPRTFADAVRWAKEQGARIATCSVIMPSWSDGAGGGPTHAALRPVLGSGREAGDVLFVASAGNLAERHWSGTFSPDRDRFHQWTGGVILNAVKPWGGERVAVELYGPLSSACRLLVYERASGRLIQQADLIPERSGSKMWGQTAVRFDPTPSADYIVAVRSIGAVVPTEPFHLVILGGHLEHISTANSIPFPGDGEAVLTLGCVDEQRQRLPYSSCGPNGDRPKPDFVARVPFPCRYREKPFTGTSAAAPQAAGVAALLLSRNLQASPDVLRETLRLSAFDLLSPGHDGETGYGLLRLP